MVLAALLREKAAEKFLLMATGGDALCSGMVEQHGWAGCCFVL